MDCKILFCMFYVLTAVKGRKYDIESEAINLYGEDLAAVLLRFRKSPDYLKILKDKVLKMKAQITEIRAHIHYYYGKKISLKVKELLGGNEENNLRSRLNNLTPRTRLREGEKKPSPVSLLDKYSRLHQSLTTADINYFKDLGFEYAGQAIHELIKHMGADDTPMRSTKLPYGGGYEYSLKSTPSTTEHARIHSVITSADPDFGTASGVTSEPTVASFRYTYKPRPT